MNLWLDRVLRDFLPDLSRLWIVDDPDGILLNEHVLSELRGRGFDLLPFDDSMVFRANYETNYRGVWSTDNNARANALILHAQSGDINLLPWDYRQTGRPVHLSIAELFPRLAPGVVRQLGSEHLELLFEAQEIHADQKLGESATKDFVLTHVFRISPYLLTRAKEIWIELLRLHYRGDGLPDVLVSHMVTTLSRHAVFNALPIAKLLGSKSFMLRFVQDCWNTYLKSLGVVGVRVGDEILEEYANAEIVPFDDPDVRSIVDSMFMDGSLHPVKASVVPPDAPSWIRVGVVQDIGDQRDLVRDGINRLMTEIPTDDAPNRDWLKFARGLGELISRLHSLDTARADGLHDGMATLRRSVDTRLQPWIRDHYSDLPSLPATKAPAMVHHIPRHLAVRRDAGEDRIALLVFDGLALDQWARIREHLVAGCPGLLLDEGVCFAWLPTLTSVSRQAIFSGQKPRDFASSIETTSQEPALWTRFWTEHGLRANEVLYRKAIRHIDQLNGLKEELSAPSIKVAGIVVDMVDEIVHGATMGKHGAAKQIDHWCNTGFVDKLVRDLVALGYQIYLTADHGNVDAVGIGRPYQGVTPELRGERVRTYRSQGLLDETAVAHPGTMAMDISGLPANFLPLFAGFEQAFVPKGDQVVVHGGPSIEELIVPFIKIGMVVE